MALVLSKRRSVVASQEIPKSTNNHQSHTISAIVVASVQSSMSTLEHDTTACSLDFQVKGPNGERFLFGFGN
jgi:hypothetical protein